MTLNQENYSNFEVKTLLRLAIIEAREDGEEKAYKIIGVAMVSVIGVLVVSLAILKHFG